MLQRWILLAFSILTMPNAFAKIDGKTVIGFSQIGAESAWRIANTKSIKDAAKKADLILVFSDAQQKQENQIKAIKTFILQKVDVIAFAPIVTSGWTEVLQQAKKAGIPVILLDRQIEEKDQSLVVTFIGADFYEEGRRAAKCLIDQTSKLKMHNGVRIFELRGTEGSAPAIQRQKGFADTIAAQSGFTIVRSENGDFKESQAKELMQAALTEKASRPPLFNAVFAHNDNMALGAIAALDDEKLKPGQDIAIVSIDAIRDAFKAMQAGKLNCSVECTPLLGPQLMQAVVDVQAGKKLPRHILSQESVFPAETAAANLSNRNY